MSSFGPHNNQMQKLDERLLVPDLDLLL